MASIVVYLSGNRVDGMALAGERMNEKIVNGDDADEVVVETLKDLITTANVRVTYTDTANVEHDLSHQAGPVFTYGAGQNLIIQARDDNPSAGANVMHIAVPRDDDNLVDPGTYLASVITDVGGTDSEHHREYILGTIMLRRCR